MVRTVDVANPGIVNQRIRTQVEACQKYQAEKGYLPPRNEGDRARFCPAMCLRSPA